MGVPIAAHAADPETPINPKRSPPIDVRLNWFSKKFPLKYRIWEAHPNAADLVQTNANVRDFRAYVAVVREITDGKLSFRQPGIRYIALTVDNPTDQDFYFYATPHASEPPESGLSLRFHCLCVGDLFRVKAHRTFVRVMSLQVLPSNRLSSASLTHELIGADASKFSESIDDRTVSGP